MAREVLTIDTLEKADQPYVVIDGTKFIMVDREDWGLRESAQFAVLQRRFKEVNDRPGFDEVKMKELASVVDDMIKAVLPTMKDDVLAKLKDRHKLAIINAFNGGASRPAPTPEAPVKKEATATADQAP